MQLLRRLMESRPYFRRIPDQTLISDDPGAGGLHLQATRDREGTYAFVYAPVNDLNFKLDLSSMRSKQERAWWYDPRTGVGTLIGMLDGNSKPEFRTPPYGPDWVLVLDDPKGNYEPPGLDVWKMG
jgi:hypothetical protein